MKLVEVIKGVATDPKIAEKALQWSQSMGKITVYAADAPGFIVNRVARHYYVESLKALEENVAPLNKLIVYSKVAALKWDRLNLWI